MHRPRRRLLRSALALLLLFAVVTAIAQLAGVSGGGGARSGSQLVFDGVHETWLVKAPGAAASKLPGAAKRLGGGRTGSKLTGDWYEVSLGDEVAAADAEAAFGAVGAVDIEPVLPRMTYAAARIAEQWALSQASDHDIDAPEAWATTTGTGAVIAIIDTGVDATHPDLAGRVLAGRDFSGASTPATVDNVGHGTQVASIVAANGTTISGVAPDAQILPLKVFRDSAAAFSMSGYLAAIRYAADQGVDVINISLGCGQSTACFSQAELDALTYATDRGVLVVAAAGNGDHTGNGVDNDAPATPDYPSGYELPGIVSVTSSTRLGGWSPWSNYGARTVDLAAPGEGILVAAQFGSYRSVSGTSFSAPYAAGVAALVAAANPGITPADLRARLMQGAVPAAALATRTESGGILNAQQAVAGVGVGIGGGGAASSITVPTAMNPRSGARVGAPPVLTWNLPAGWKSQRVRIAGAGASFDRSVRESARALAHPSTAWRSGTYRWRVVARDPQGRSVTSKARSYSLSPRLGAWVTSGRIRSAGRVVRLRVGYASSTRSAKVRVRIRDGKRLVHSGRNVTRRVHAKGKGSPRRGWFAYDAALTGPLAVGRRITVEVRVSSGRTTLTRRFRATVR